MDVGTRNLHQLAVTNSVKAKGYVTSTKSANVPRNNMSLNPCYHKYVKLILEAWETSPNPILKQLYDERMWKEQLLQVMEKQEEKGRLVAMNKRSMDKFISMLIAIFNGEYYKDVHSRLNEDARVQLEKLQRDYEEDEELKRFAKRANAGLATGSYDGEEVSYFPNTSPLKPKNNSYSGSSKRRNDLEHYARYDEENLVDCMEGSLPLQETRRKRKRIKITRNNGSENEWTNLEIPPLISDIATRSSVSPEKENQLVQLSDEDSIAAKYPKPPSAPPLTVDMLSVIKEALTKPPKEKVVSGFSLVISQEDLAIFDNETEWLNDRNVDFYLELIKERGKRKGYPKVYVFHSFFYTLLTEEKDGYTAVEETTGDEDIFAYDIVFFPVNISQHWRLVEVNMVDSTIYCYDSIKTHDNMKVLRNIVRYLKQEYNRKYKHINSPLNDCIKEDGSVTPEPGVKNVEPNSNPAKTFFTSEKWTVPELSEAMVPQQKNAIDCGIFILQYAEYLSRCKEFDFDQSHIPYFRQRMMYETLTKQLLPTIDPEIGDEKTNVCEVDL